MFFFRGKVSESSLKHAISPLTIANREILYIVSHALPIHIGYVTHFYHINYICGTLHINRIKDIVINTPISHEYNMVSQGFLMFSRVLFTWKFRCRYMNFLYARFNYIYVINFNILHPMHIYW
jgi:hypothetical protein